MSATRKPSPSPAAPEISAILSAVRQHVAEQNAALEKRLTAAIADVTRNADAALATVRGLATEASSNMRVMTEARAARIATLSASFATERDNVLAWLKRITMPPPDVMGTSTTSPTSPLAPPKE